MRDRTHWCVEKKHDKCGKVVYVLQQYKALGFLKDLLDDSKFVPYKCFCVCHKPKIKKKYGHK